MKLDQVIAAMRELGKAVYALKTDPPTPSAKEYVLTTRSTSITVLANQPDRYKLRTLGAMGFIHADFTPKIAKGYIMEIPAGAPTPTHLIEVQHYSGAKFWINKGQRAINGDSMVIGQRVILDLTGFFSVAA